MWWLHACVDQPPCVLSDNIQETQAVVHFLGDSPSLPTTATISRGTNLSALDRVVEGRLVLSVPGYAPTWIDLSLDRQNRPVCVPSPIPMTEASTFLDGELRGTAPLGGIEVVGCGGEARSDTEGRFQLAVLPDTACKLWVRRPGGAWSEPEVLTTPPLGQRVSISPWAPPLTFGMLGVLLDENLKVSALLRRDLALREGDRLRTVDGQAISAAGDLKALISHRPGESVLVGIARGDEELTIETEILAFEDWSIPGAVDPKRIPDDPPIAEMKGSSSVGRWYGYP